MHSIATYMAYMNNFQYYNCILILSHVVNLQKQSFPWVTDNFQCELLNRHVVLENRRLRELHKLLGSHGTEMGALFPSYMFRGVVPVPCWDGIFVQIVSDSKTKQTKIITSQMLYLMYEKGKHLLFSKFLDFETDSDVSSVLDVCVY